MRRTLKLAALLGGISALAWSLRKRIRIAVRKDDPQTPDPGFHIVEPEPAQDEAPAAEQSPTPSDEAPQAQETGEDSDGAEDPG